MKKVNTKVSKTAVNFKLIFILAVIFILGSSTGCLFKEKSPSSASNSATPPLTTSSASNQPIVYTSIYPLYDFTQKIGGEKITVINITPAGAEPHSFEPSTKLLADLSKAELFIYNGAGMEPYLEKFLTTLKGTPLLMIQASHGINLIQYEHEEEEENEAEHCDHTSSTCCHGETDPHVWLSPSCALSMGQNILHALIQVDPDNKAYYESNFREFKENLTELDNQYKETLSHCKRKDIVVTHEAFGYLCQEYGLHQVHVMGLNSEAEPTPGKMKEIIKFVKREKINHIFFEALYSPKVSDAISRETGAHVLQLNPLGSLTEKEIEEGKDYFSIMKENLENLKQALEFQP